MPENKRLNLLQLSNMSLNIFRREHLGHVYRDLTPFCLLFLAVNHSKAGNEIGLGGELVLRLGIRLKIVLGVRLGLA